VETNDHYKNGATSKSLTSRTIVKQIKLWQRQRLDHLMVPVQQANLLEVDAEITPQHQKVNSVNDMRNDG